MDVDSYVPGMFLQKLLASSGQAPAQRRPEPASSGSQVAAAAKAGAAASVDGFKSSNGTTAAKEVAAAVNGTDTSSSLAGAAAEDVSGTTSTSTDEDNEEEGGEEGAPQALQTCVECEDQRAELTCLSCEEPFCRPCWGSLHRCVSRAWVSNSYSYRYSINSLRTTTAVVGIAKYTSECLQVSYISTLDHRVSCIVHGSSFLLYTQARRHVPGRRVCYLNTSCRRRTFTFGCT